MTETDGPNSLVRGYSGRMFVALTLGVLVIKGGRFTIPPLLPDIIDALAITPFKAGIALTTMTAVYAFIQYPSGRASDRLSRKTLLVIGVATTLAGFLLVATAPMFAAFVLGAAVIGAGDGLYSPGSRALVSDLFVDRRGQAFGVHMAFIDIGGVAASGVAIAVLALATWQAAFVLAATLAVPVVLMIHVWSREPYVLARVDLDVRDTVGRLVGDAHVRWLVVVYSMYVFTWRSVSGFLPTFLQAEHGFSPALAGTAFAVLYSTGIVAKPLSGRLSDRFSRLGVAVGAIALDAVGLLVLILAPSPAVLIGAVALYGIGHKSFSPATQAFFMESFPDSDMAGDFGAVRGIYQTVSSLGPAYVGYVASQADYTTAYVGLFGLMTLSTLLTLRLSRM